jgi:FkbM family methyltransferase
LSKGDKIVSAINQGMIFSFFKIFIKLGDFLFGKDFGRISGFSTLCGLKNYLYFTIYNKIKPKGLVLINVHGNNMYINPDDRGIAPALLMDGVMEQYETELFKNMAKEGMVVVDIGANIGYYSLIAAKLVGMSGIVYAFEPEPTSYELLCKNIELNSYLNIVSIQKSVSNKQGKADFWVDNAGAAISSFAKDNVIAFSKSPVSGLSEKPVPIKIETISLDEFFKNLSNKIDLIKIDTQGAEGLILEGADKILTCNHNIKIIMEFWPDGLKKLGSDPLKLLYKLQKYGFTIKLINETKQVLEPIEPLEFCRAISKKPGHQEFNLLLEK